jgi:hypothetical protein
VLAFLADLPMIAATPLLLTLGVGWQVSALQIASHACKLLYLRTCSKSLAQADAHRAWQRSSFILLERLLHCLVLLYMLAYWDAIGEASSSSSSSSPAALQVLGKANALMVACGGFAALWHIILTPLPFVLELPMLALLLAIALCTRVPATVAVLAGSSVPSRLIKGLVTKACSIACQMVTSMHAGNSAMCTMTGPDTHVQLAMAVMVFLVLLMPLYIR